MAQILPFCGWRFDLSQIGALADVLAPASPPLSTELHKTLRHRHPCNAVRLVDPQSEPGDPDEVECFRRAGGLFRLWRREGVLVREHEDTFYAVQVLHSTPAGDYERWSVIGLVRPEITSSGLISPACPAAASHAAIQQTLQLRLAAEGDFSPVQAAAVETRAHPEISLSDLLQLLVRQITPVESWSDHGERWRIWPLNSSSAISQIQQHLSHCRILVIAGANSLQAALQQQQLLASAGQPAGPRDPAGCALIAVTGADDPGMPAAPAAFLFSNAYPQSGAELRDRAEQVRGLVCRFSGNDPDAARDALELAALNDEQPCLAAGTPDGEWHLLAAPARCRTTPDLLELLQQTLAPNTPQRPLEIPATDVAESLQVPTTFVLAAPSPWTSPVPGMERSGGILPTHADLLPPIPAGLVFSAHTNVTGRSQ